MQRKRGMWVIGVALFTVGLSLADGEQCALLPADVLEQAQELCAATPAGKACVGAGSVTANGETVEVGSQLELATLDEVSLGRDGLALIKTQADLAADDAPVMLIAYGETRLKDLTQQVTLPLPTISIRNPGLYVLNLRDQPNRNSVIVGTFDTGYDLIADGRNDSGGWLHVQTPAGAAWISASVVQVVEGNISDLTVLDSHYIYDWQRVELETSADCGGVIVQSGADRPTRLQINETDLLLNSGAFTAQAQADQRFDLRVLNGEVTVRSAQFSVVARQSDAVSVRQRGLVANGEPLVAAQYPFAAIANAPLSLLPAEEAICLVGVADTTGEATLFNGPGEPYSSVGGVDGEAVYIVTGQNTAEDGSAWWRLEQRQWVAQSAVQTAGICNAVVEAPKPSLVVLGSGQSVVHNFLPAGTSVWAASTSADQLSGSCETPPIAQCSHPVAIIPDGRGGISWRGQEPNPYPMGAVAGDTFAFSGRNQLGNAKITLSLQFTSEGTWGGQMTLVYDNDPDCTHTFFYSASRTR
jgi:predicted  nucleic acid-binding Zn-ribbon protein